MSEKPENEKEECISEKPWTTVLNKAAKLGVISLFKEGGGSIGRFLFIPLTVLFVLAAGSFALDYFTGWLSDAFDFWPFNRGNAVEVVVPSDDGRPWYKFWGGDEAVVDAVETVEPVSEPEVVVEPVSEDGEEEKTPWYCKFNPVC